MVTPTHNPKNERIKRQYHSYQREAQRRNTASIDAAAKALNRFEESTGFRDFRKFHREQAVAFKRKLDEQLSQTTGERLSRSTVHTILSALRCFFIWLAGQPGYRRRISYSDADYFNLSEKDVRIANARRERPGPTMTQMHCALAAMPSTCPIELRDRAVFAFTLLTGTRDGALISLKMKHLDLRQRRLDQDAREVQTKYSKTFSTWLFPVGAGVFDIIEQWVGYLRVSLHWGEADPLFPATLMGVGAEGQFSALGLDRTHWSTAEPVRRIFKAAFERVDLPYFPPHSVRKTLVRLGEERCRSPEEFKAWSQNLGHEGVLTTFTSYGAVSPGRQAEIIGSLVASRAPVSPSSSDELVARIAALLPPVGPNSAQKG
jgi:integrase